MTAIVVNGAAGRMGRRIISCALADGLRVAGAVEQASSPFLGQDAGELAGEKKTGLLVTDDLAAALKQGDVVIDFSHPETTLQTVRIAAQLKKGVVIGTTGLTKEQKKEIESFSKEIPILLAPNMSVGVNLLFELASLAAKKLGPEYDIEIVEAHHRFKKDAPSGTAIRLAEVVTEARHLSMEKDVIYGRHGKTAERKPGEVAVHAVRGGDIVGDHTISFTTLGERIEITHQAHSRDTFAHGSLRAARFLASKKPGFYSMREVLEANEK